MVSGTPQKPGKMIQAVLSRKRWKETLGSVSPSGLQHMAVWEGVCPRAKRCSHPTYVPLQSCPL